MYYALIDNANVQLNNLFQLAAHHAILSNTRSLKENIQKDFFLLKGQEHKHVCLGCKWAQSTCVCRKIQKHVQRQRVVDATQSRHLSGRIIKEKTIIPQW